MNQKLAAAITGFAFASSAWAVDVGVAIEVGDPDFYGRIEIGNVARPVLIYEEPIVVHRGPAPGAPLYLRVPPGHAKKWKKHCARYDACSRPVYFVQDDWYTNTYAPQVRSGRKGGPGHDKGHGKGKHKDKH